MSPALASWHCQDLAPVTGISASKNVVHTPQTAAYFVYTHTRPLFRDAALTFLVMLTFVIAQTGLLDQRFALRWLNENIAAFGGDVNRLAIWGQSAGGQSICFHLASPGSAGLFTRAISSSGPCVLPYPSLAAAERDGLEWAHQAGCGGGRFNSASRTARLDHSVLTQCICCSCCVRRNATEVPPRWLPLSSD